MKTSPMSIAVKEAFLGMRKGEGGPFGAVIIKGGKVIARAHNTVLKTKDPTAHAEVNAIRKASKKLKRFDLSDCVIYSTCEPCPMCFSAIYWANIKTVYFCSTRHDANVIGFKDNHIYEELTLEPNDRKINFQQVSNPKAIELFAEWMEKEDKITY